MKIDLALRWPSEVGEGPIWDYQSRELIWIDVTQGELHRFQPDSGENRTVSIGKHLGAVGLYSRSHLVAAVRDGFALIEKSSGELTYLNQMLDDGEIRFNDGKCDPVGRFVAGTMRYEPTPKTASLYSCDIRGNVREILPHVGLSNGLCWNLSGKVLFYIDTLTKEIAQFDYELDSGEIGNRKVIYKFSDNDGSPDGMTIDNLGRLWIAIWGGWRVVCIDQKGNLIQEVKLPVSQPTSIAFGGEDLCTMFVTSARFRLSESDLSIEPFAGSVFAIDVGVSGVKEPIFGTGRSGR